MEQGVVSFSLLRFELLFAHGEEKPMDLRCLRLSPTPRARDRRGAAPVTRGPMVPVPDRPNEPMGLAVRAMALRAVLAIVAGLGILAAALRGLRIAEGEGHPAAALPGCDIPFRIGLGEDPERILNAWDPDGWYVFQALQPDLVVAWLNGYRDPSSGRVIGDLSYFRDWAARGRFAEWGAMGVELMIITWENYDGQSAYYGPPTYGDYHISAQFLEDIAGLAERLADYPRAVYFVLATEFSTYPACRYDPTCSDPLRYSDRYNAITREYYDQLIPRLQEAMSTIRSRAPRAQVGIGFGGWLATFDENTPEEKAGRSFIRLFEPLIRGSDWIFFQSMIGRRAAENGGLGNPDQIRMNVEFFAPYGKPIGVAHYNPGLPYAERLDVMQEDLLRMLDPLWQAGVRAHGLRLFAFMRYGPMRDHEYNVLDLAVEFAGRIRTAGGCVYLPLILRAPQAGVDR